jgi:hypothetical protein
MSGVGFKLPQGTAAQIAYRVERTSSRQELRPVDVERLFMAHCYANDQRARLAASVFSKEP